MYPIDWNDASIKTVFSVFNPKALVFNLLSIPYDIAIYGDKIASGGIVTLGQFTRSWSWSGDRQRYQTGLLWISQMNLV